MPHVFIFLELDLILNNLFIWFLYYIFTFADRYPIRPLFVIILDTGVDKHNSLRTQVEELRVIVISKGHLIVQNFPRVHF
jgi:hypothetical protein